MAELDQPKIYNVNVTWAGSDPGATFPQSRLLPIKFPEDTTKNDAFRFSRAGPRLLGSRHAPLRLFGARGK